MSYAFKTGIVDTTSTGVTVTPGDQQAAFLTITDGEGSITTAPTPHASSTEAFNTSNVTVTQGAAAFELVPADAKRSNLSINYQGTGIVLIGTQDAVTAGTPGGYALADTMSVNMGAAPQSVWCVVRGSTGNTGIVSVSTVSMS